MIFNQVQMFSNIIAYSKWTGLPNRWTIQSLFLTTIMGICIGFTLGIFVSYFESADWSNSHRTYTTQRIQHQVQSFNKTRLLCWIMTCPENYKTKAQFVKLSWGRRCDKLLFMSTSHDSHLDTIALPVQEGRKYLWSKTKEAYKYIYENHMQDADWFLKADDDTYVVVENVKLMLQSYDALDPWYFGCKFKLPNLKEQHHQGYTSGGAGYVLSREAVRRFVERALPDPSKCRDRSDGAEDVELGFCLENVNVKIGESRDGSGRNRFFPLSPSAQITLDIMHFDSWYWQYRHYGSLNVTTQRDPISEHVISFHYVQPRDMLVYDLLLYHIKVLGIN